MATAAPTKVITGEVRCSYVHLDKAAINQANPNGEPKFSLTALIPKTDTATINKLRAAQQSALQNGAAKKFGGEVPTKWKDTIHDGDNPQDADLKKNPEYAGHWFVAVSNTQRPQVVDRNIQPVIESGQLYSGMYARLSLNAYPFNSGGSKGVSFALNNVQKLRDGEPLGGVAASAEDDFADFAEDADSLL